MVYSGGPVSVAWSILMGMGKYQGYLIYDKGVFFFFCLFSSYLVENCLWVWVCGT